MATPIQPGKGKRSSRAAALERELDAITESLAYAVSAGAGLPELARIVNRALGASVAICDSDGSALAVAGASRAEEQDLLAGRSTENIELLVDGEQVGWLRLCLRSKQLPPPYLLRFFVTTIALEVAHRQAPSRSHSAASAELVVAIVAGKETSEQLSKRAQQLEIDISRGQFVCINMAARVAQAGDWRGRALATIERAARTTYKGALTAYVGEHVYICVPSKDEGLAAKAADHVNSEIENDLSGIVWSLGSSRVSDSTDGLYMASCEALLAANVARATRKHTLSFEDTGAYRLLLGTLASDEGELRNFFTETVAPLIEYDEQYQTGLVETVETYLEKDGKIEATAKDLFTHRHTIRYRLERVRELTQLDISSSEGREKLSLGLKSMRVLGITPPRAPADEGKESKRKAG